MLDRFKKSLLSPSQIGKYLNDSFGRVALYFSILIAVMILPTVLALIGSNGFGLDSHQAIFTALENNLRGEHQIIDGQLAIDSNQSFRARVGRYNVFINSSPGTTDSGFFILFEQSTIAIYTMNFLVDRMTYEELNLNYYDFNDVSLLNMIRLSQAIEVLYLTNSGPIRTFEFITDVFRVTTDLISMILIISLFSIFLFRKISFGYIFKLNIYAATIYALFYLLAILFSQSFLTFVGMFVFLMYSRKAFSKIIAIPPKY